MSKYNYLTDNELSDMILSRTYLHTELEKELATRLTAANDYILDGSVEDLLDPTYDELDLD